MNAFSKLSLSLMRDISDSEPHQTLASQKKRNAIVAVTVPSHATTSMVTCKSQLYFSLQGNTLNSMYICEPSVEPYRASI